MWSVADSESFSFIKDFMCSMMVKMIATLRSVKSAVSEEPATSQLFLLLVRTAEDPGKTADDAASQTRPPSGSNAHPARLRWVGRSCQYHPQIGQSNPDIAIQHLRNI